MKYVQARLSFRKELQSSSHYCGGPVRLTHSSTLRNGCMFYMHEICTALFIQVFDGESRGATT